MLADNAIGRKLQTGGPIRHLPPLPRLGLYFALAFILGTTLFPSGTELSEFVGCIVCGTRGWADAVVNVILFAPFGAALAAAGRFGTRPIMYAFALSCAIELAQTVIPGRDPSLGDVCFNTLGAAVGQVTAQVVARSATWDPRNAGRLSVVAAVIVTALVGLTGWLLLPAFPVTAFRAWYTAARPDLELYRGRVLRTTLGSVPFGTADVPNPGEVRQLLLAGAPLRILAVAGPRVRALGPLFVIENRRGDEIFLVGPDRDDLVLRYRTRATVLRLDQPDLRLRHAFAGIVAGDTLRIDAHRAHEGYCLDLNQARACRLGFTAGTGWALLLYPRHFPAWLQHALSIGWVAGLVLPVGLSLRRRWEGVLALALLVAGLTLIPPAVGLLATPASQWFGAGSGVLLGVLLQWLARGPRRPSG